MLSQTCISRLASLQDESPVHRFRNVQFQPPQPQSLQLPPSLSLGSGLSGLSLAAPLVQSASQPSSFLDDDDFGDFASPSNTTSRASPFPAFKPKTFSSTFPIDQPIQALPVTNTFPIDQPISISRSYDIDKPVPVSSSKSFAIDEPVMPVSRPLGGQTLPPPPVLAAAPMSGGGDKYSALRNLLEDDFCVKTETVSSPASLPPQTNTPVDLSQTLLQPPVIAPSQPLSLQPSNDFDDFGDFVESTPTFPADNAKILSPVLPFIGSIYNSSVATSGSVPNFPTLSPSPTQPADEWSMSPPPPLPPPMSCVVPERSRLSDAADDEDALDEWSLPVSGPAPAAPPVTAFSYRAPAAPLPFLSSSPPPPMTMPGATASPPPDTEEFSLPSEQFGFSDQEIFGIKKQKQKAQVSHKPQSIQDVIGASVNKKKESQNQEKTIVEEKPVESVFAGFPQKDMSPSVSPEPGLRVNLQSPESQSIASLELESREEKPAEEPVTDLDTSKTTLEKSSTKSVYSEWLILMTEIKKLYETIRNTFDNILYEDLKEELITHEKGKAYLDNLTEVHKVFIRVVKSYRMRVAQETARPGPSVAIDQMILDIESSWRRMEEHCRDYSPLPSLTPECVKGPGSLVCSVCLGQGAELELGEASYCPQCANFWVNCVSDVLPSLHTL